MTSQKTKDPQRSLPRILVTEYFVPVHNGIYRTNVNQCSDSNDSKDLEVMSHMSDVFWCLEQYEQQ